MKRLLSSCALLMVLLAWPASAGAADFTISPSTVVKTGNIVTFDAIPPEPADSWDLDGDGFFGDKVGSPVQWTYGSPGPVSITLDAPDGRVTRTIQVIGPSATFVSFPAAPVVDQPVKFVYSSQEATNSIEWDLDADGVFGDVKGAVATMTYAAPGTYAVSLRVTDIDEPPARSTSTQLISVAAAPVTRLGLPPKPQLMSPFPIIRITGKVTRKGARIKRLTVRAPFGATINVRCRGRGCPFRRKRRTVARAGRAKAPTKTIRIKQLERRLLRAGVSVKVWVSRQGEVGKYTRFRIRKGKPPVRTDLCIEPGSTAPLECPAS